MVVLVHERHGHWPVSQEAERLVLSPLFITWSGAASSRSQVPQVSTGEVDWGDLGSMDQSAPGRSGVLEHSTSLHLELLAVMTACMELALQNCRMCVLSNPE